MILASILAVLSLAGQAPAHALELLRAGRGPAALEAYRVALLQRTDDAHLRRDAIGLAFSLHRYNDVLQWTAGRAELVPEHARALFFAARYEEALALLDPARGDEAFLVLDALEALARFDEEAAVLADARARFGADHPAVAAAEGRAALRAADLPRAIERFRAALASDAWRMDARFGLGRALVRAGEREQGRHVLEEHRRLVPLFDRLDFAERGVELDPAHGPNHARVGDLEREIGRFDRAEAAYRRALELSADDVRVPVALRLARFQAEVRSDLPAAIATLERERRSGFDARVFVRLGDYLAAVGRVSDALAVYRDVLALRPDDVAVLARVAELEAR